MEFVVYIYLWSELFRIQIDILNYGRSQCCLSQEQGQGHRGVMVVAEEV